MPVPDVRAESGSGDGSQSRRRIGIALAVSALVAGAACSGGSDGLDTGFSARSVLAEIPADVLTDEGGWAIAADLDALAELSGVDREPVLRRSENRLSPWGWVVGTGATEQDGDRRVVLPQFDFTFTSVDRQHEVVAELGWSFDDVAVLVEAGGASGTPKLMVASVHLDVVTMPEQDDDGIIRLGDGADREFDEPTALRPLGVPLRVGVDADRSLVAVSDTTPIVSDWLEGGGDTADTLAPLSDVAELLDRGDELYAVSLGYGGAESAPDWWPEATGVGYSGIDDTQRIVAVLQYASADDAATALEDIESDDELREEVLRSLTDSAWEFVPESFVPDGAAIVIEGTARPRSE